MKRSPLRYGFLGAIIVELVSIATLFIKPQTHDLMVWRFALTGVVFGLILIGIVGIVRDFNDGKM